MASYAVLLYHKNPERIYASEWITRCLNTIKNQTFTDFDVLELAYGGGDQLFDGSYFQNDVCSDFVEATNCLLDLARDKGYRGAFNVHLDDFYAIDRFAIQVEALKDFDLVSSNFYAIDSEGEIVQSYAFDGLNIQDEMDRSHNILCNPVVAFSRKWLEEAQRFDPLACPAEDFQCWKANRRTMRMVVLSNYLCYKRMHPNEASNSPNR